LEYRRFVERGLLEPVINPLAEAKWQAVLGSEKFQQRVRDRLRGWKERRREIVAVRQSGPLKRPEDIVREVGRAYGMKAREVRQERGRRQEAKGAAMSLIWEMCGLSLREIGEYFGGMDYAAVAQQVRRTRLREQEGQGKVALSRLRQKCQGV
jgi:chromosomal replication initiation ATPase DnaA